MRHTFMTDGRTVWVNGDVSLLGRFGVRGIDIHRPLEQKSEKGECLYCTHAVTTRADWDTFVEKMLELFAIKVPTKLMPERFRTLTAGAS